MNNIFKLAERCLYTPSIEQKLAVTAQAAHLFRDGSLDCRPKGAPRPIRNTVFPARPELVDPRDLPRRNTASQVGRIALLHSIAHIEFYAIHLAWDMLYRFREMPEAFYLDGLTVAAEEAVHFQLVRERMRALGSDYGRLVAHRGLWETAEDTDGDVLARLALVPRYMEARGLDVTPGMIAKFRQQGDAQSAAVLGRILDDEVGHVAIGTRWFHHVCSERGLAPEATYFDLLQRNVRGTLRGPLNIELRKSAGFSHSELQRLERLAR